MTISIAPKNAPQIPYLAYLGTYLSAKIWSSRVSLKKSCKMQFRRVDLRSKVTTKSHFSPISPIVIIVYEMIEWELREDITKRPPFLLGITKITFPPCTQCGQLFATRNCVFLRRLKLSENDTFCSRTWLWVIDNVIQDVCGGEMGPQYS